MTRIAKRGAWLLAALSGGLQFAAFPPWGAESLGWICLVPLLGALRLYPSAAGRLSFVAGLCMWVPSLWFLSPVTIPGALVLAVYCALYHVPAGLAWSGLLKGWEPGRPVVALRVVVGGAAFWAALESLRGWLFTGFPWNGLGISQWENYALIQVASLGGVEAVSFILVLMNLGIGMGLLGVLENVGKGGGRRMHPELYFPVLVLTMAFTWGGRELRRQQRVDRETLRVAVVQPLADNKWSEELAEDNYRVLEELTEGALVTGPELVLWPETAIPEALRRFARPAELVRRLTNKGVPILLGSLDIDILPREGGIETRYTNSAFLVEPGGVLAGDYRKRHLVMFGEYIPFGGLLPFLRSLTPFEDDVFPGEEPGLMDLRLRDLRLGVLICFEDLMPASAHELAAGGARLLVTLTNDAWFDPFWGSHAHLAHAVFRSIEQRRPGVRSTNSGISAWIDERGVVRQRIEDPLTGQYRIRGSSPFDIEVPRAPETTFFHRHPRAFPLAAWFLSLLLLPPRRRLPPRTFHETPHARKPACPSLLRPRRAADGFSRRRLL